jgi:hypothetical protein
MFPKTRVIPRVGECRIHSCLCAMSNCSRRGPPGSPHSGCCLCACGRIHAGCGHHRGPHCGRYRHLGMVGCCPRACKNHLCRLAQPRLQRLMRTQWKKSVHLPRLALSVVTEYPPSTTILVGFMLD